MTIIVAYAPRPEGQVALFKGIEIARRRNEHLLVVNATPGSGDDAAMASAQDVERIERLLDEPGLSAEFKLKKNQEEALRPMAGSANVSAEWVAQFGGNDEARRLLWLWEGLGVVARDRG